MAQRVRTEPPTHARRDGGSLGRGAPTVKGAPCAAGAACLGAGPSSAGCWWRWRLSAFAASNRSGGGPRRSYVVTSHALPTGARLQPSVLQVVAMDLSPELRAHTFGNRQVLLGATFVAPLGAGELVQPARWWPGRATRPAGSCRSRWSEAG